MNKKISIVGLITLTSALLATTGNVAYAKDIPGDVDHAKSDVKIKVKFPNIEDKETLAFDTTPDAFDFGLKEITKASTNVEAEIQVSEKISVIKDYARDDAWNVRATATDLTDGENTYALDTFALNNQVIVGTGANPVIMDSKTNGQNGVGTYDYPINSAKLKFNLPTNTPTGIKNLKGSVNYVLAVTEKAE